MATEMRHLASEHMTDRPSYERECVVIHADAIECAVDEAERLRESSVSFDELRSIDDATARRAATQTPLLDHMAHFTWTDYCRALADTLQAKRAATG